MTDLNMKTYQIKREGHLSESWADWFDGLAFLHERDGTTSLTSEIIDQTALHGLLKNVRDLGLPLISVNQVEPDQVAPTDFKKNNTPK